MYKSKTVQVNKTLKILWDFDINMDPLMDPLIQPRKLHQVVLNKKIQMCHLVDFTIPADHRLKIKESKNLERIPESCQGVKKILWIMKVTVIPIKVGALRTIPKKIEKRIG